MDHEPDKRFLEETWLEPLTIWSPRLLGAYRKLLKNQKLNPTRIGKDPNFWDEFPIYSRYRQLEFLRDLPQSLHEEAVFLLAVRYWMEAEANLININYQHSYMLFISIVDPRCDKDDDNHGEVGYEYFQPYIYFCGLESNVIILQKEVSLSSPTSPFSQRLAQLLIGLHLHSVARMFEHEAPKPDGLRVFIDFDLPCNPNKVLLGTER